MTGEGGDIVNFDNVGLRYGADREVLSDGAVPMDVLEAKVERWIAARR